ncbi:F0F1 ATP synthase subunit A [Patescibacteria group bacterium]|nr:F0F1 ATP synthase subunit A [Patescibacteria group bacterium]MBU1931899.1 F0F1 ATP synthase subunit A [Patescibacteria group bacterium]
MAKSLHISVAAEPLFHLGPLVVSNSMIVSWIVVALFALFAFWYDKQTKKKNPGRAKIFTDTALEGLYNFFKSIAGEKGAQFFPLLGTFFLFILLANWLGLLPGVGTVGMYEETASGQIFIPFFRGATADLNMTLALGLISVVAAQIYSIKYLGFKAHVQKYISPNPLNLFIGILELVSEISRVISFSFRLFGNIFAGEVLLTVMLSLLPFIAPLPFLLLEIFVGLIQALVFTMLSLVFMSIATTSHGGENHTADQEHELAQEVNLATNHSS